MLSLFLSLPDILSFLGCKCNDVEVRGVQRDCGIRVKPRDEGKTKLSPQI